MQNLGKGSSESVNSIVSSDSKEGGEKSTRQHIEISQDRCSKSKKITKIIHNTIVFYVDQRGEKKTLFYQKLRNRKSKEATVSLQKIRKEAEQFSSKHKAQAQATLSQNKKPEQIPEMPQLCFPWSTGNFWPAYGVPQAGCMLF